ncbi:sigma 54-interacting transcriptional regulator [Colwellia psychrerythraea]|uniref:Response regulator receiver protein n=1 Tax=Colwellia psychrerythraea TaxID=28229 RepID=A0A099KXB3_COLPS|nr:sigma 54-interacting transcriptional regulator [Colwellia psychrerythraea]KGJ95226.1 response regulator receiver protein [Colwellia psychrerythraea]
MNNNKRMIDFYAEAIARLTGASFVNIACCQSKQVESFSTTGELSDHLLPEFDLSRADICLPKLKDNEKSFLPQSTTKLTSIFKSQEKNSFIIHLSFEQVDESYSDTDDKNSRSEVRRRPQNNADKSAQSLWLGLTFTHHLPNWLSNDALAENGDSDQQFYPLLESLLKLGYLLVNHLESTAMLLRDPVTSLSSRIEFQSSLRKLFAESSQVAMIMINLADFQVINKKFGHDVGDQVITKIAQVLSQTLRKKELISRFGGTLFAIALPFNSRDDIANMTNRLYFKLQQPEYLQGAFSPQFKLGASVINTGSQDASITDYMTELITKTDQALHAAKTESQLNIVIWHPQLHLQYQQLQDYISGIFTADTTTDYRNMSLLWDISNLVETYSQFDVLFDKVTQRFAQSFNFDVSGLVFHKTDDEHSTEIHLKIDEQGIAHRLQKIDSSLDEPLLNILQSSQNIQPRCLTINESETLFVTPFNEHGKGLFYLRGTNSNFNLESASQLLLTALIKQLGRAYAREILKQRLNLQLFNHKEQLQAELDQLKQTLHSSEILYHSKVMEDLMKKAHRSATSDTTTLIIGESGTGKERLVHAIHQKGNRRDRPLVIVDCGAITETLIESELFGHVKGAFTGAERSSKGRIFDADSGILMLDEIGELPLRVQAKLLRFVQEKQFTPVGATKINQVDVKIIAVTNRDLQHEVNQGQFRQDLFYRLNVVVLQAPPLRERVEDIPLLAQHFLKKSALLHDEPLKTLLPDALDKMMKYSWPGNIRELENCLIQATLLCESSQIKFSELGIAQDDSSNTISPQLASGNIKTTLSEKINTIVDKEEQSVVEQHESFLKQFNLMMAQFVRGIVQQSKSEQSPLGRWLEDDLLLLTYLASQKNTHQVAMRLGLSHSTVRRKINKISSENDKHREKDWQHVMEELRPIINGQLFLGNDTLKRIKLEMLHTILHEVNGNATLSATLMGISEPTFYKWKKEL